ncbi:MAG: dCMP deaminase family protein [Bacteroidia bacterium]|nr:dCMP deaminase family protein [Bacteroidia bacterium]
MMSIEKAYKYMELAYARARFSKDTSTKVGAIIVGPHGEDRSSGYNGSPRGCSADEGKDRRGTERPEKYFWFSHAELNAITNAARVGTPLDNCTIFVTHPPCMDCARAIVQAGIKEVFTINQGDEFYFRWCEHIDRTKKLFEECEVKYIILKEKNENHDQLSS